MCLIGNCSCWWDGYDGKTKMREVKQSCHTVNKTDLLQPLLPPSVASPLILCTILAEPYVSGPSKAPLHLLAIH